MALQMEVNGPEGSPEGKNTLRINMYGGCSSYFLSGHYPAYDGPEKGQYTLPLGRCLTMTILTDHQEKDAKLMEKLKAAGFVKILGCRTTHGAPYYDVNLWAVDGRKPDAKLNPKAGELGLRLNPELFGGNAEETNKLTAELKDLNKIHATEHKELLDVRAKLADAQEKIAEQKIALSQKRLLRKRKTTLNLTDPKSPERLIPRKKGLSGGMRGKRPSV